MKRAARIFEGRGRPLKAAVILAGAGALGLALGAALDRTQFFCSYLIAYAFVVGIATGALILLMICHTMRAGWPILVRRLLEGIIGVFPLLAGLFLPLCFGLGKLYPWLYPERFSGNERELIVHKLPYLNVPFFVARAGAIFAVWVTIAWLLRHWSFRQDDDASVEASGKLYRLSAAALPAVALATSFAAFDWLMSLTPTWASTMYPIYFFGGGFLAAIALLTASTVAAQESGYLPWISDSHYYALGRLLLAFTVFWGYAAFFQFMLIWIANRPDEVGYYTVRWHGPWRAMSIALVIGHFFIPFLVLLNYRLKRDRHFLSAVSAWILVLHYVDVLWLVAPARRPHGFPLHWLDLAALACVGGLSVAAALLGLRGRPLLPIHDPRLDEALRYESL